MDTVEEFERRVSIAAEDAKDSGFIQTHLALLEVLQQSRMTHARTSKRDRLVSVRQDRINLRCEPRTLH